MAKVIGLIQVKGGAGRSTVATNIAGELSKAHRVALIDCDMPQGTSASWAALRQEAGKAKALTGETATTHRELVDKIELLSKSNDYLILDGPPRIAEITRTILVTSDLCLVPMGASAAEIWATSDILSQIKQADAVRTTNVRLLWTRYRAHTRLAQNLTEQATQELGLKPLRTTLGFRVAYAEALGEGLTAAELADASARTEITELVAEIRRILR